MRERQAFLLFTLVKIPREQKYSRIEKECLAVVQSCQSLREYLMGKEFMIETDHFPLQYQVTRSASLFFIFIYFS